MSRVSSMMGHGSQPPLSALLYIPNSTVFPTVTQPNRTEDGLLTCILSTMLNCIFIRDVSGVFFSVYMNCHESFGL